MYYTSIIIAITSGVFYHIIQKSITSKANPLISLVVTYTIALVLSLLLYAFDQSRINLLEDLKAINWASYVLGIAIVGLEFGILLAYRNGWDVGKLSIINNIIIAAVLVPIGLIMFKEQFSVKAILGISVSLLGLLIMKL
ncbi:MAG: EamA family transporter [Clostridiales bacterium]|nr:EamA family transporter [Clostridiales bacterium]